MNQSINQSINQFLLIRLDYSFREPGVNVNECQQTPMQALAAEQGTSYTLGGDVM